MFALELQVIGNYIFSYVDHAFSMITQRFAAVIMRIRDPKTTALIFASGKMVIFVDNSILQLL